MTEAERVLVASSLTATREILDAAYERGRSLRSELAFDGEPTQEQALRLYAHLQGELRAALGDSERPVPGEDLQPTAIETMHAVGVVLYCAAAESVVPRFVGGTDAERAPAVKSAANLMSRCFVLGIAGMGLCVKEGTADE